MTAPGPDPYPRGARAGRDVASGDQHLAALRAALDGLEGEVRRLAAGLTEEQLQWATADG